MHPVRKKRLFVIIIILALLGSGIGLIMYALQQNINLFYSPSQIAAGKAPYHTNIRAGGMVVEGSVVRDPDTLAVSFDVTDFEYTINMEYVGILPDLFREGQGIVAQGRLNDSGTFEAIQVLAKHDEKYMPPEVTDALESAQNESQSTILSTPSNY